MNIEEKSPSLFTRNYQTQFKYGLINFPDKSNAERFLPNGGGKKSVYQNHINKAIKRYYKPNTNILDVGANCGIFTIAFAKICNTCTIHSFEPLTFLNKYLAKSVKDNHLTNVKLHHIGLGDKNEKSDISFIPKNLGCSSIVDDLGNCLKTEITIQKLDDLNISNISFIKVDIQNYEYQFLLGAKETLINNDIALLLELPRRTKAELELLEKCTSFMYSIGYYPKEMLSMKEVLFTKEHVIENKTPSLGNIYDKGLLTRLKNSLIKKIF